MSRFLVKAFAAMIVFSFSLVMLTVTSFAQVTTLQNWTYIYHGTNDALNTTYSVTTGTDQSRVLIVAISTARTDAGPRTVSVSYGGQPLILVTGDLETTSNQHSALYILYESGLDAASNSTLSVTFASGTTRVNGIWASVYDYVDQTTPVSTSQQFNSGSSTTQTPAFNPALSVEPNDRTIGILSSVRTGSSSSVSFTAATNWTLNDQRTYGSGDFVRTAVASFIIPTTTATTESIATITTVATLASMAAISLKFQPPPPLEITCPPIINAFVNPSEGLINAWLFDESSGTKARDVIGNKHGTLINESTWDALGKYGNAVSLDGTSGYVALPNGIVSTLNSDFTISLWVYLNSIATWSRVFDFGTNISNFMFLTPRSGYNNTVMFSITTSGLSGQQIISGTSALSAGAWHHVVVTLAGNTGRLYINGSQVGIDNYITLRPSNLGNTNNNLIGKSQWADPLINGRVDEFRIYNRALSAEEVQALLNANQCDAYADYGTTLGVPLVSGGYITAPYYNDAVFPLNEGTQSVTWTVTDSQNSSQSCTQTITVVPSTVTFDGTLTDQCANSTFFTLTGGSPAGGTYSGDGVTCSNFDASSAGAGTHTITYTYYHAYADEISCPGSATNTIQVNALSVFTAEETKAITCHSATNGEITITVTETTSPPYFYRYSTDNGKAWLGGSSDPDGWIQFLSGSSQVITGLGDGTYLIHVKDANGCVQTACD